MITELLSKLKERFSPTVVPPCRVCGGELELASFGGGQPTQYRCKAAWTAAGATDWGHYERSGWEDRRQGGDPDVIELISIFESGLAGSTAMRDVVEERQRQITKEGFSKELDDEYELGELRSAAAAYVTQTDPYPLPADWPWPAAWWKPRDTRSNLVRAGALILAEIERLDRSYAKEPK